jgi:hypothetical protein
MAEVATRVMPRNWSATSFLGLSAPEESAGLSLGGGVDAGRRAVFSRGIGAGCSRLRFGDGWASWVRGMSPDKASVNYMGAVGCTGVGEGRGEGNVAA